MKMEVGVTLLSDFRPSTYSLVSDHVGTSVLAPGVMVNTYLIDGGVENYP